MRGKHSRIICFKLFIKDQVTQHFCSLCMYPISHLFVQTPNSQFKKEKKKQHSFFRIQMPVMTSIVMMLIQNQDQPGMMKTGWWHNMFLLMRSYLSSPFKCCFSSVPHSSWLLIWLYLSGMALGVQEKLQQFPITVCVEWVLPLVQEWEVMQTDNYITFSYFLFLLFINCLHVAKVI